MDRKTSIQHYGVVLLFAVLALACAWRIVVIGIGQHLSSAATYDVQAAERAARWRLRSAALHYRLATQPASGEQTQIDRLRTALNYNPADGRVLATFARELLVRGDVERAQRAAELAARLLPFDANAQLQVADFWVRRGTVEGALPHWDAALRSDRRTGTQLFPAMLHVAEGRHASRAFMEIAQATPPWWPEFFAYAVENATRLSTLDMLYTSRRSLNQLPTIEEIRRYMSRLQEGGFWKESFFIWLAGLDDAGRQRLAQPYNGGFERATSNYGFDWHLPQTRTVKAETKRTVGVGEARALRVMFHRGTVAPLALYQPMVLAPSKYRFSGRIRLDSLNGNGGVRWQLACADQPARMLARTASFAGADEWRGFAMEFIVPPTGCDAQTLSLEDAGWHGNASELSGAVWFDDFAIERI